MSILDVVGPVIIGPSSSHTAGAARIGKFAGKIYDEDFKKVKIILYNSFAETGRGHGTDKAILGGLLGFDIDDERLLRSFEIAKKKRVNFEFDFVLDEDVEPNCAKIIFFGGKSPFSVTGVSVGGGEVEIREIEGYPVLLTGKYPVIVHLHKDVKGIAAFITSVVTELNINIAEMNIRRDRSKGEALAVICLDSDFPKKEVRRFYGNKDVIKVIVVERLEE